MQAAPRRGESENPRAKEGDNSSKDFSNADLRALVQRVEQLLEEKKTIQEDINEVMAEAKGNGFDTKTIRAVIKIRAMDRDKRRDAEDMLDVYLRALGDR